MEQYRFFDSVDGEDERFYTADEFAEYFRQLITSGIFNGGTNLQVVCNGTDMNVSILPGYAWIEGYLYKIDTEPLILALDAADPALDRIDRVVIRLDKTLDNRYVKAFVLKGEAAEEPTVPGLTRNGNVYEISLAQIKAIAGKSFIAEAEIADERFDEKVCGLVNSLIKVDTSQLISKWEQWLNGIKDETFVPKGNFVVGFIKTQNDLIHAIPDRKVQLEKGWPRDPNNIELDNARFDEEGNLCIDIFQQGGNLFDSGILEEEITTQSPNLYGNVRVALPFTVTRETNRLSLTAKIGKESISYLYTMIYEAGNDGLPDMDRQVGGYFPNTYEGPYSLEVYTWEVPLSEVITPGKQYFVVIYGRSSSYYHFVGYKSTPGKTNYYFTTDGGASWTPYEYTAFLQINSLVDEGSITMSRFAPFNFKNHLSLGVDVLDSDRSSCKIDILDMEDNIIKQGVEDGEYLLDIDPVLHRDIKLKLTLTREGFEEPKLANYWYRMVEDIAKTPTVQSIIPSNEVIFRYVGLRTASSLRNQAQTPILKLKVPYGGSYRIKGEFFKGTTPYGVDYYFVHNEYQLARVTVPNTEANNSFLKITADLLAVPAGAVIEIKGSAVTDGVSLRVKDLELLGSLGFSEIEVI